MNNKLYLLIFCIILLIPLIDLVHPGFPVTHDGQDHIARIANFYQNLKEGIIIPRWAANLNWGYGHPILMFLYPLPSYLASFLHFIRFSLIDSTKITFALGMFFSGITMYIWLSSLWGKPASFLGALLYVYAPYRFVDLYVRGDIGENLAFVFIPLVLFFIHNLTLKKSNLNIIGGSISLALLILAHNAVSLMILPFIILYAGYELIYFAKNKSTFLFDFFLMIFFGFSLSAFFWIPGIVEAKYTLRNIVTKDEYSSRFVTFSQLIYGPWSYGISGKFTLQIGILQWFFLIISTCLLPFLWTRSKNFVLGALLIGYTIIAICLMLPISKFIWERFILLQNFQFPWRFLVVCVFTTSILGGYIVELLPKFAQKIMVFFFVFVLIFLSKDYWHANSYKILPERFFTGIYNGTTDTGESAPIWSVRFMEKRPSSPISVISGKADIVRNKRTITSHTYNLNVKSSRARILENTLFFPGWEVFVDGIAVPIQFQDQIYRGLIIFYVPNGKHSVSVLFGETKLRLISDIISAISIFFIFSFALFLSFPRKRESRKDQVGS